MKDKAVQLHVWTGPQGSNMLRLSEYLDNWTIKLVRFSALCASHLYPPEGIAGNHFY